MKKSSVILTAVLYVAAGAAAHAQGRAAGADPTKIGIIDLPQALARTKEGQKAGDELKAKFAPRKAEYDKRQAEIDALTDRLSKGLASMSPDAQKQLNNEIQSKTTSLKRYGEDSEAAMEADQAKSGELLQNRLRPILQQYAIQHHFTLVLDIGNEQTPVEWFAMSVNITDTLVALYDQTHPVNKPAGAPAKPAAAPKPPAAPPVKKQE